MHVHVGCSLTYACPQPTPMLFVLRPSLNTNHYLIEERRYTNPVVPINQYMDSYGNEVWRLVAPTGRLQIKYDGLVALPPTPDLVLPDLPKTPVENLPYDVIIYTLPSRLCPSDLFVNDAWQLFGHVQGGWAQVQAVCDWLHSHIVYGGDGTSSTTAWDAYHQRRGVCRDFAHLGVAFCRALNFPARYVCGYLPDINVPFDPTPMDFHAWFEVYIDGVWCTFDARHNSPRIGRVLIARGRDAIDIAFATVYGSMELLNIQVWADQVDEPLSLSSILGQNGDSYE
ncbi:MAG: transglutaminase family protein [Anaerolineae bacterium]|nr:transglutaminase family protein [Anaerolineae bacterium]